MKEKICFECRHYLSRPRDIWCEDCVYNGEHIVNNKMKDNFTRNVSSYNQMIKDRIFGKKYRL